MNGIANALTMGRADLQNLPLPAIPGWPGLQLPRA